MDCLRRTEVNPCGDPSVNPTYLACLSAGSSLSSLLTHMVTVKIRSRPPPPPHPDKSPSNLYQKKHAPY